MIIGRLLPKLVMCSTVMQDMSFDPIPASICECDISANLINAGPSNSTSRRSGQSNDVEWGHIATANTIQLSRRNIQYPNKQGVYQAIYTGQADEGAMNLPKWSWCQQILTSRWEIPTHLVSCPNDNAFPYPLITYHLNIQNKLFPDL